MKIKTRVSVDNPVVRTKDHEKCLCGSEMPWHLIRLDLGDFEHVCTCSRLWKIRTVDGTLSAIHDGGTRENPLRTLRNF